MLINTLDWFAGDDADLITTYKTGTRVRVPLDGTTTINEVDVELPAREGLAKAVRKAPVQDGGASFYANRVGVHKMTAKEDKQIIANMLLAANLADPSESKDWPPSSQLTIYRPPTAQSDQTASSPKPR